MRKIHLNIHYFLLLYTLILRYNTLIINEKRGIIIMTIPLLLGDPHGARTHDPNIKSVVLYQLS